MQDWFGSQGVAGISEIVENALENIAQKELEETREDIISILHSLKDDRPDIVLKYMKYLEIKKVEDED